MDTSPALQTAIVRALHVLMVSIPATALLLAIPAVAPPGLLGAVLVHLSAVVVVGLLTAGRLSRLSGERWFVAASDLGERVGVGAATTVLVTGVVALVTLASSAALRLDASLQFLQLLSALDIAWVTTATMVGVGWWRGRKVGLVAAWLMAVVCIWSIWTYLQAVGFTDDGGWLVDRDALMRYVLPFDLMAAVLALSSLVIGARRAATDQATEQRSPQS